VLVTLIDLSMMSRRELERRMVERGVGVDLGRVLKGRLQLRFCHVAAICQALDLHPLEFAAWCSGSRGSAVRSFSGSTGARAAEAV